MFSADAGNKLVAESPTATITLAGVQLGCILDTGAMTSLIPSVVYNELLKPRVGDLAPEHTYLKISGVDGEPLDVQGYVELPLEYGNCTVTASFLVTNSVGKRGGAHPVLLGCNNLRKLTGLKLPTTDSYAWQFVRTVLNEGSGAPARATPGEDETELRLTNDIIVPACTIRRVVCSVSAMEGSVFISPLDGKGVEAVEGCEWVREHDSSVSVMLANHEK